MFADLYNQQQLDANRDYAGSLVFQEGSDGEQRGVIDLGQARVDENGDDSQLYRYGVITEDGYFDTAPPSK